jgi:small subunit ribosomal protein S24e
MEIKILSDNRNPMLKRREISFSVEHEQMGSTPSRKEVRAAVAVAVKTDENVVFVKRFVTKTGMQTATGFANVYESIEQAKLIEPEYIVNRNIPPEKPKEEVQG